MSNRFIQILCSAYFSMLIASVIPVDSSAQSKSGTSFDGRQIGAVEVCTASASFMSEDEVNGLISEMLKKISTRNRFIVVACPQVPNCQAVIYQGKPYILYNPEFLGAVKRLNFSQSELPADMKSTDWKALTILAHEIGHHLNNHISNPPPDVSQRDLELEADESAGFMIYMMGGTIEQANMAFQGLPETDSYTHPGRQQRVLAITKGWIDAKQRFGKKESTTVSNTHLLTAAEIEIELNKGQALFKNKDYQGAYAVFNHPEISKNATAAYYLGIMYNRGIGVQRSISLALMYYTLSAEQGYVKSMGFLGDLYSNGGIGTSSLVQVNKSEAFKWYRKAAEQGDARSQYHLGRMYAEGEGINQNYIEAAYWYRKSAEQGNEYAQTSLGIMYKNGQGVQRDYTEAVKWFLKSAEKNESDGEFELAYMYENGLGVVKSIEQAIYWYRLAYKDNMINDGPASQALKRLGVSSLE